MKLLLVIASALMFAAVPQVKADVFGCQAFQCYMKPGLTEQNPHCQKVAEKVQAQLEAGAGFPSCPELGSAVRTEFGENFYDACPDGMTALPDGQHAVIKGEVVYSTGIGEGEGVTPDDQGEPKKVCVGEKVGEDKDGRLRIGIYAEVELLSPAQTSRYFDIFLHGKMIQRTRY